MKKRIPTILVGLCLVFTIAGCKGGKEQEILQSIRYSNLKETSVQDTLKAAMKDANISEQRQEVFFTM